MFWLSCVEKMTNRQIAEQLEIEPTTVAVHLHRARKMLQQWLADQVSPQDHQMRTDDVRKP